MDLTYVYRIVRTATAQYIFFSAAYGTPCILSDHNEIKLLLNNKISRRKCTNNWRPNNTLLNDQWARKK
jgi:hypothetical protein